MHETQLTLTSGRWLFCESTMHGEFLFHQQQLGDSACSQVLKAHRSFRAHGIPQVSSKYDSDQFIAQVHGDGADNDAMCTSERGCRLRLHIRRRTSLKVRSGVSGVSCRRRRSRLASPMFAAAAAPGFLPSAAARIPPAALTPSPPAAPPVPAVHWLRHVAPPATVATAVLMESFSRLCAACCLHGVCRRCLGHSLQWAIADAGDWDEE